MKVIRTTTVLIMGVALLFLSGCKKDSVTNPFDNISLTENAPTFSNNPNSFAFSITANNFTHNYEYMLNMNSQNLGIAITVTNYARGNATITLYSDTNAKLFSRDLSTNTSLSETFSFDSTVRRVDIQFFDYTATFNCAITTK